MLSFIVGFIIGVSLGTQIGLYMRWAMNKISAIWERDPEPKSEVVTPLPAGSADVFSQSSIVTPITPYEEELREKQRLEKYNG